MKNFLLAGVGGQGTVFASRLIAQAAIMRGEFARTAETIGMAQRGGCVVSHVRLGQDTFSPLIPCGKADVILGFEPGEAVRSLPYLREKGVVVSAIKAVQPVSATLGVPYDEDAMPIFLREHANRLVLVDTESVTAACGTPKVLNVAILGAAIKAGALGITMEEMEHVLRLKANPKFIELNLQALSLGSEAIL